MKRKTIRNHKDFLTAPDDPVVPDFYFIVKAKPAVKKDSRYGLVASKRTFKLATLRNRAKRLLRDWIAYNEHLMNPSMDYIFIARASILNCRRGAGRKKMAYALKKISK